MVSHSSRFLHPRRKTFTSPRPLVVTTPIINPHRSLRSTTLLPNLFHMPPSLRSPSPVLHTHDPVLVQTHPRDPHLLLFIRPSLQSLPLAPFFLLPLPQTTTRPLRFPPIPKPQTYLPRCRAPQTIQTWPTPFYLHVLAPVPAAANPTPTVSPTASDRASSKP